MSINMGANMVEESHVVHNVSLIIREIAEVLWWNHLYIHRTRTCFRNDLVGQIYQPFEVHDITPCIVCIEKITKPHWGNSDKHFAKLVAFILLSSPA